ncbi:MAG: hypothetical protein ACK5NU_13010 [Fusobacterium ulcerans]|uniref:hypothetical protein n=1 Tax=Fusobacterium ulcerans TaxID=861 RepID=UPI003A862982
MIEKIMKAVKSGNKKRGRNITVGAVVGMLLSCTVAMGASTDDKVGLEIKDDGSGNIEFSKEYPENTWDAESKTYTNNSGISVNSDSDSGSAYGLKLSDLSGLSFINNGSITGTSSGSYGCGYGIYNKSVSITELTNNGTIIGNGTENYGIYNKDSTIETITNKGRIIAAGGTESYGIYNEDGSVGSITNTGKISGNYYAIYNSNSSSGSTSSITSLKNSGSISSSNYGIGNYPSSGTSSITSLKNSGSISAGMRGIYNAGSSSIGEIINSGTISASTGIDNESSSSIGKLKNSGIIYGQSTAISNYDSSETISNANNYGLLVSSNTSQNVVNNITIVDSSASATTNEIKNYGLVFIADSNKYIGGGSDSGSPVDYHNNFGKIHQNISIDGVNYDIINVDAEVDAASKEIKNWKSLTLEEGKLTYYDSNGASDKEESISPDKKYILNGIEDTLKISGRKNELNNSVVNAYKTAVVMDQEMSMLTLDNTVVNGGVADGSTTISITENGSTLTIKGDSVINTRDKGVAITVDGNDNAVTLEGNAIVNGKMESNGNNILNLYGKADGSMNMFYDISGFTDISIDNNVTFFEDMKVTGTDKVTVEKSGVLSLRLKKEGILSPAAIASSTSISTATHAFSGTDGMTIEGISPEEAGTLNFITNGIGKKVLVNMKNIELNNIKVKTNSIIDKVDLDTYKDEGYILRSRFRFRWNCKS